MTKVVNAQLRLAGLNSGASGEAWAEWHPIGGPEPAGGGSGPVLPAFCVSDHSEHCEDIDLAISMNIYHHLSRLANNDLLWLMQV